jgi:hypothetical protein
MQTRGFKSHVIGNNVTIIQPTIQTIRVFQTTGGWDKEREEKERNENCKKAPA